MTTAPQPFDLSKTYVHLGLGAVAFPVPDFQWTQDFLERYGRDTEIDGVEGRLVCITRQDTSWTTWERHPAGEEVVLQLSGASRLIQELPDGEHAFELTAGQAVVNPRNVWHTADVIEAGFALFITPGVGTQNRDR